MGLGIELWLVYMYGVRVRVSLGSRLWKWLGL